VEAGPSRIKGRCKKKSVLKAMVGTNVNINSGHKKHKKDTSINTAGSILKHFR
jgi:hypothetical protein